jgi:hypothetical protein
MKRCIKRNVRLELEELEDRTVPAYLAYQPQAFTITVGGQSVSTTSTVHSFQLRTAITDTSDPYMSPNGRRVASSWPNPFQDIMTPTPAEFDLLRARFPAYWATSGPILSDNSLIVCAAEALGPSRQLPAAARATPGAGQSLFIKYSPHAGDPPAGRVHWLQFVTTNTAPFATGEPTGHRVSTTAEMQHRPFSIVRPTQTVRASLTWPLAARITRPP